MRRALLILALCAACTRSEPVPADVSPQHDTVSAIPDHPVRGTLRGVAFEAQDARYVIHRQIGREKVQIHLSASSAASPCGPFDDSSAPAVWIRFPGAGRPEAGERRRGSSDPGPGGTDAGSGAAFEVHYQVRENGRWTGNGRAAALLSIHDSTGREIEGELSVCFADGRGSCVAGAFKAHRCPDPVAPNVRDLDTEAAPERR